VDAVALVGAVFDDLAQEDELIVPLAHGDIEILQPRRARGEFGQLVVVRGERCLRADLVVQVFDDGPRVCGELAGPAAAV